MVAPCDKYQGLVVGPDGQTVADPYGMFPTLADYSEWREVADRILTRAEDQLAREAKDFGPLAPADVDALEAVRETWNAEGNAYWQAFKEFNWLWGASISKMVVVAQQAACQLGIIEARIVAKGGEAADDVPTQPEQKQGKGAKVGGLGVGLLAIGALFLFTRD